MQIFKIIRYRIESQLGDVQLLNTLNFLTSINLGTDRISCVLRETSMYRVVEACAIMWPPIGFFGSDVNIDAPST